MWWRLFGMFIGLLRCGGDQYLVYSRTVTGDCIIETCDYAARSGGLVAGGWDMIEITLRFRGWPGTAIWFLLHVHYTVSAATYFIGTARLWRMVLCCWRSLCCIKIYLVIIRGWSRLQCFIS